MATLFAAALDERLGTMLRFFLVALALAGPIGWWRFTRARRLRGDRRDDQAPAEDAAPPPVRHDLAWLVAEIDELAAHPDALDHGASIEIPEALASQVWSDPDGHGSIARTVLEDAARRSGVSVAPGRDGVTVEVRRRTS